MSLISKTRRRLLSVGLYGARVSVVVTTFREAANLPVLAERVHAVARREHLDLELLVVDDAYRCVGLITVKDIEKAVANPNACKDEQGRLRVAAATTVGDKGF